MAAATTATTTKARGFRFALLPEVAETPPSTTDCERFAPQTSQVATPKAPSRPLSTGAPHFGHRSEFSTWLPSEFSTVDINQILPTTKQNDSETTASSRSA